MQPRRSVQITGVVVGAMAHLGEMRPSRAIHWRVHVDGRVHVTTANGAEPGAAAANGADDLQRRRAIDPPVLHN
eukprot:scaffold1396_cov252-Pinguiococcus_pyrenoidosus.AAC.15